MAQLAIRGHASRGKEVIELLEMLGGNDINTYRGHSEDLVYFINYDYYGYIGRDTINSNYYDSYNIYSLEDFLEKFPYKVGDKVFAFGNKWTIIDAVWDGSIEEVVYTIKSDTSKYTTTILSNQLQLYKEEIMENKNEKSVNHVYETEIISFDIAQKDKYELDLQGKFEIKLREGKYFVERIKPQYPTTYEECCELLGKTKAYQSVSGYRTELLEDLQKLLICRDAYWKIAGEQMGLGKPWEPDYANLDTKPCYYTIIIQYGDIIRTTEYTNDVILTFPTIEVREAFYDNFKDLIEKCKELL